MAKYTHLQEEHWLKRERGRVLVIPNLPPLDHQQAGPSSHVIMYSLRLENILFLSAASFAEWSVSIVTMRSGFDFMHVHSFESG